MSTEEPSKQLVKVTHFFALPAVVGSPSPGAADYHQYTITIEDAGKQHSVNATDPLEDPNLQALLANLKTRADCQLVLLQARLFEVATTW